jgi:hypothetical protein
VIFFVFEITLRQVKRLHLSRAKCHTNINHRRLIHIYSNKWFITRYNSCGRLDKCYEDEQNNNSNTPKTTHTIKIIHPTNTS